MSGKGARPTTAQIASQCEYVLDLERRWEIACAKNTTEGDAEAAEMEGSITAWWSDLEYNTLDKARAALYVRAEKVGALAGLEAAKKALVGPLDARIKRAKSSLNRINTYVLPELVRVERARIGYDDEAREAGADDARLETDLGNVTLERASSPSLIGPKDANEWPARFTEPKALTAKAKAHYKAHPDEMGRDGFYWSKAETIRVR